MARTSNPVFLGVDRFFVELSEGLRRQGNVIFALVFREFRLTSSGRSALSMIWVMVETVTQSLTMAAMWYVIGRTQIDNVPSSLYLLVSFTPYLIISDALSRFARSLNGNAALFAYQRVKPIDLLLARFTLDLSLLLGGAVITLGAFYWFIGYTIYFDQIGWAILMLLLTIATSFGLSLIVGTYGKRFPVVYTVIGIIKRGMLIASGVIMAPTDLPASVQPLFAWNPTAILIDQFRAALLHTQPFQGQSLAFCLFFALSCNAIGLIAYYVNRHTLAANQ